ncbi:MAG: 6-hydroxymethylpterin diphosphokinase MptE-like protein [Candidatus Muiribacteriota bacterium]
MEKKNLSALKVKDPALFIQLKPNLKNENFKVEKLNADSGGYSLKLVKDDNEILLHSKRNPEKEAEDFIAKIDETSGNLLILYGMGLGYHVRKIFDKLIKNNQNKKLIVVEPSWQIFNIALHTFDFSDIISNSRVEFSIGQDAETIREKVAKLFKMYENDNLNILEMNVYRRAFSDFFSKLDTTLKNIISVGISNYTTVAKYIDEWNSNILENMKHIIKSPGMLDYEGKFKNKPAIIISAGPSLDKNGIYLKQAKGKALLVAVDTAVKPLLSMGITPDVVVSVDSQYANYLHLKDVKLPEAYCVCSPIVHPEIPEIFEGRVIFFNFFFQLSIWIEQHLKKNGILVTGGSVATVAYDFARKIGADPIVFVGQDLSFPGGFYHAVDTHRDQSYFENSYDSSTLITKHRDNIVNSGKTIIKTKDIYDREVITFRILEDYCRWIEYECKVTEGTMINATEGGILKENVKLMTLKDTIKKYLNDFIDVHKIFVENYNILNKKEVYDFSKKISEINSTLDYMKNKAPEGMKTIKKMYEMMKINNIGGEYQQHALKAERIGKTIEEKIGTASFIVEKFQTMYWPFLRQLNSNPDYQNLPENEKTLELLNIKYDILTKTAHDMKQMFEVAEYNLKKYLKEIN